MQPLDKTQRSVLERTVMEARDIAEAAAQAAVDQLGVGEPKPYAHLSTNEKELRRRLRIHGRQLGDIRDATKETQETDRLVEEIAYEHWHRMLFARFLAENNLLMYPDPDDPVAVSLEECKDLAEEEGAKSGWELASRFATRMLPQIFRTDSPVFQFSLPPEHEQKLERLLADLPPEVFQASDSIGWVYQFWQAKKKDEVNRSEVKIGARELPAVTQLFTEPYMVSFLLDNSLGAWWAARRLTESDLRTAKNEEELRQKASLPGVPLEYLRFVKDDEGKWTPAAGTFDGWPEKLSELKTLDPCCGSGHFLVAAFNMLVPMRMEMEGLSARGAVDQVLTENIHGLEIDQRCVELAAFALALSAWRYPDAGGYRQLPQIGVSCSGLAVGATRDEWQDIAKTNQNLRIALGWLHDEFIHAPILGSLLNPRKSDAASIVDLPSLTSAFKWVADKDSSQEEREIGVVAQGLSCAADLLAKTYHLVITNVPYLARGKQDETLQAFSHRHHPEARPDLATTFLDRCLDFCAPGGTTNIVLPQNWLFLASYKRFRQKILKSSTWHFLARLGEGGFESSAAAGAFVVLVSLSRVLVGKDSVLLRGQESPHIFHGLDASGPRTASNKANLLINGSIVGIEQSQQLKNPGVRISLEVLSSVSPLEDFAVVNEGLHTGDYPRFGRKVWEVDATSSEWSYQQGGVTTEAFYSGLEHVLYWENGRGELIAFVRERLGTDTTSAWIKGESVWGHYGIAVGAMRDLKSSAYTGALFTHGIYVVVPKTKENYPAIAAFCTSPDFCAEARKLDQKVCIARDSIAKVHFDLAHWSKCAAKKYPQGVSQPESNDPTQWIFHGQPTQSDHPLQVAVARLLGYRWPAELDKDMELSDESRALVVKCEDLLKFADKDGIVCIPPVRGEESAADRLLNLLAAAYGDDWSTEKLSELLKQADHSGKTLDSWLRDKFFSQHCQIFHQRPFIWHIWDGLRDGFSVLVNYHKLDRKNLETLIYTYLGDWIRRQKDDRCKVDGAEERLVAAENLKKHLELILEGEAPYDIFVRWKPIEKQPIGWEPNLNDGVRLNIRPFISVPDVKKKGAGVLREKPRIHWKKDRGKDVKTAPWYHLFKGDRINNHHLSLEEKRAAREVVR